MKVAVITPIPTPYRDPFWNVISARPCVSQLDVYYCARGKADRPWDANWEMNYQAKFLQGTNLLGWGAADASCYWNPTITRRICEGRYDALLVGGYNHMTMVAGMCAAVRVGIPFYLMCETWSRSRRSLPKRFVKDRLMRWIVHHAAGLLPTGALASEYLLDYGADPAVMTLIPNVPDVDRLQSHSRSARTPIRLQRYGSRPVVLFVGRMIPKKRPDLLIRAFHRHCHEHEAMLVLAGSGPLQESLERVTAELNISNRVEFAGFVQPNEIGDWYTRADVFVMPSTETWGVSVIEALACGTPVIVSDQVGCHRDAMFATTCGTVVRANELDPLAQAIRNSCLMPTKPRLDEHVAAELRNRFSYLRVAERLVAALRAGKPALQTHQQALSSCAEN